MAATFIASRGPDKGIEACGDPHSECDRGCAKHEGNKITGLRQYDHLGGEIDPRPRRVYGPALSIAIVVSAPYRESPGHRRGQVLNVGCERSDHAGQGSSTSLQRITGMSRRVRPCQVSGEPASRLGTMAFSSVSHTRPRPWQVGNAPLAGIRRKGPPHTAWVALVDSGVPANRASAAGCLHRDAVGLTSWSQCSPDCETTVCIIRAPRQLPSTFLCAV